MKTNKCYQCKKEIVPNEFSTGYGIDKHKHKICFSCCGENDKKELLNSKIGDKFSFYYSNGVISNWPGTLKITPYYVKQSGHNWRYVKRTDVWFSLNGLKFWGKHCGSSHEIMSIQRIKSDS